MNCRGCLKEGAEAFCPKCKKELFGGQKVNPALTFNSPHTEDTDLFLRHTEKISISGVQVKYSLKLQDKVLRLTDTGGMYILKPVPYGQFKNLDQAPANEHISMQIARQVYNINVPPNALVSFKEGSPAYLVRRFDQNAGGGKLQQEDFAQIAQMTSETHGVNYKYDLSYEEIGALIRQYIPTFRIELEKFFKLILFNYVFSNGDAHLKNFSVIRSAQGDYILTPAYDLLCTRIHSPGEADMALTLFKDSFGKAFEAYGFYTYTDFLLFGKHLEIKERRIEKLLEQFSTENKHVKRLVDKSFLDEKFKTIYYELYLDKIKRLKMKF